MGEHDIEYRPRTNIKVKALANFLVEIPDTFRGIPKALPTDPLEPEANKYVWELHTDGAASKEGSGVGMILKKPQWGQNNIRPNILFSSFKQ